MCTINYAHILLLFVLYAITLDLSIHGRKIGSGWAKFCAAHFQFLLTFGLSRPVIIKGKEGDGKMSARNPGRMAALALAAALALGACAGEEAAPKGEAPSLAAPAPGYSQEKPAPSATEAPS